MARKFNELQQRFEYQLSLNRENSDITANDGVASKSNKIAVVELVANNSKIPTLTKLDEVEENSDAVETALDEIQQEEFTTAYTLN